MNRRECHNINQSYFKRIFFLSQGKRYSITCTLSVYSYFSAQCELFWRKIKRMLVCFYLLLVRCRKNGSRKCQKILNVIFLMMIQCNKEESKKWHVLAVYRWLIKENNYIAKTTDDEWIPHCNHSEQEVQLNITLNIH